MINQTARLNLEWENFLSPYLDLKPFYKSLDIFLKKQDTVIPEIKNIFNVFDYMSPASVRCVLFGEDPYPRLTSACGIAFWDKEIISWNDKSNGNSLKNILKALLVAKGLAAYSTKIDECRIIAGNNNIKAPAELFEYWLKQGVLLVNTSLTFSNQASKKAHFEFWLTFHKALIQALNSQPKPYYILWGKKAQNWEKEILKSTKDLHKIIKQGHPTFIHQFLEKDSPQYSPFTELAETTGIKWL
jgi:uracil-DNA glycosylase